MSSIDPLTVEQAIIVARSSNRELYALGYKYLEPLREYALEVLADEVERLRKNPVAFSCPFNQITPVP